MNPKKISLKSIREYMSKSDAISVAFSNLFVPLFIKLFLLLGVTANQISIFNFLFVLVPAFLISTGEYWIVVLGSFLLQLHIILDYSDGAVARITKTASVFGGYYECLFHNFVPPVLMLALGVNSYRSFGHPVYLFLGGITAFFMLFIHQLKLNKDREVLSYAIKSRKRVSLKSESGKKIVRDISYYANIIVRKINGFSYMLDTLLILAIFNVIQYAIIFYSSFYFMIAVAKLYIELKEGFNNYILK